MLTKAKLIEQTQAIGKTHGERAFGKGGTGDRSGLFRNLVGTRVGLHGDLLMKHTTRVGWFLWL
jgi:hypothetical protein